MSFRPGYPALPAHKEWRIQKEQISINSTGSAEQNPLSLEVRLRIHPIESPFWLSCCGDNCDSIFSTSSGGNWSSTAPVPRSSTTTTNLWVCGIPARTANSRSERFRLFSPRTAVTALCNSTSVSVGEARLAAGCALLIELTFMAALALPTWAIKRLAQCLKHHIDAIAAASKDFSVRHQMGHWKHSSILVLTCFALAPVLLQKAAAQVPPSRPAAKIQAANSRQLAAVGGMAASIARQSDSVRRQLKSGPTTGFFDLPAPEGLARAATLPACDALSAAEIDALVDTASRREGVEPTLIRGVMKQESAFRPCAVSPKGALGLMQLMPQTVASLDVSDPFDPQTNVDSGARLLRQLLQHYEGNLALTLGAYNAGPRRVDAEMAVPDIPETTNYVQRILSFLPVAQMRSFSSSAEIEP